MSNKKKPLLDIQGERFGRLIAVAPLDNVDGHGLLWRCLCDGGETCYPQRTALIHNRTRSCGCLRREVSGKLRKRKISLDDPQSVG